MERVIEWQWIILVAFGVLFFLAAPYSKTVSEFFSAKTKQGTRPGFLLLVSSLVISWIFAKSITNAANLGLEFGIVGGLAYGMYYLSFVVAGLVIYQLRKKGGFTSIHHFLQTRFGRGAVLVFSLLIAFRLFNEVWSNTMVIGSYFGDMGSTPYYYSIIVFTLLTLIYSLKGGLRSSLLTDAIQMIFFAVLLIGLLSYLFPTGDISVEECITSGEWTMGGGLNLLLAAVLQCLSYPFHDPVLTDRGFITDEKITLRSFLWASVIGFICIVLFSLVGVYAGLSGLKGQAAVEVSRMLGFAGMLAMNFIMVTSAASTLDSAFSSFSKLVVIDLKVCKVSSVSRGRLAMVLISLIGTIPVFLNPEILSATTISGTMVMGLAPVFLFWNYRGGSLSFQLPVWFGILVGVTLALDVFPDSLVFSDGRYASLLWANFWGLLGCFFLFFLPGLLKLLSNERA